MNTYSKNESRCCEPVEHGRWHHVTALVDSDTGYVVAVGGIQFVKNHFLISSVSDHWQKKYKCERRQNWKTQWFHLLPMIRLLTWNDSNNKFLGPQSPVMRIANSYISIERHRCDEEGRQNAPNRTANVVKLANKSAEDPKADNWVLK